MSKERSQTVVFLRHAVARHNFPGADLHDPALFDPPLILQGKLGAVETGERIRTWWHTTQAGESIELVICSPLSRCIQTAALAFLPGDNYEQSPLIVCDEYVREATGMHYPDKRREKSLLQKHWPMVTFSDEMTESDEWWSATKREAWNGLHMRIDHFLQSLVSRPVENIVVISHGVWIEALFRAYSPAALGDRRVYNLDAFSCRIMSNEGRFIRMDQVTKIE